jgi:ATP phosphoribosyltransferase regulatory subunit
MGKEIARGGRYDNIGAFFGRKRSATGFSSDLKLLSTLGENSSKADEAQRIFAPFSEEDGLYDKIRELRALKYTVIQQLPGQSGGASELDCTSILEKHNQQWVIKPLSVLE